MKNRYGDEYHFEKLSENTYTIVGELNYWRFGGREGQQKMDDTDLGFVDPSGGPFISIGYPIEGRMVKRISFTDKLIFEVE